jgi:hypothetical protein
MDWVAPRAPWSELYDKAARAGARLREIGIAEATRQPRYRRETKIEGEASLGRGDEGTGLGRIDGLGRLGTTVYQYRLLEFDLATASTCINLS